MLGFTAPSGDASLSLVRGRPDILEVLLQWMVNGGVSTSSMELGEVDSPCLPQGPSGEARCPKEGRLDILGGSRRKTCTHVHTNKPERLDLVEVPLGGTLARRCS